MSCTFDGCQKPHYAKGWCKGHYTQAWKGRPLTPLPRMKDDDGFCYTCDAIKVMHGRGDNLKRICDALGMTLSGLETHARRHGLGSQMAAEFRTARRSDAA